ncbi:AfsR/SARP family transcriptional regulator [Phytomonospora endophytica]|nr:BTAD domain-containing putative transcriptional regulator [Phytomonospora endophytica]GIG69193.1 SARP family transcriptional regulator [Phytomonospora endophytica]
MFRLLGPVSAVSVGPDGPVSVQLGGPRQRSVLAALLLHANVEVPYRALVPLVWDVPPGSALANLRKYVWQLRRAFNVAGLPATRLTGEGGVLLTVGPGELDTDVFTAHADKGRIALAAGDPRTAAGELRAALAAWRGDALTGVEPTERLTAVALGLTEQRAAVELLHARARLALGEHQDVVGDLRGLLIADPTREEVVRLSMLALYRAGRRSEALALFRATSERLADQGLEPGAPLAELHRGVLRDDPVLGAERPPVTRSVPDSPDVPAQLPHTVEAFAGRAAALSELDGLLAGSRAVAVVSGSAGVGKTTLAVHWAHRARGAFPDGQLYVDLHGFGPAAAVVDPSEALRRLLTALGAAGREIPDGLDERAAHFRSLVDGRGLLVVLDNARDAAQVRPLLPGSAGSVTVVTSRDLLSGLVTTHAARPVVLGALTFAESRDLLAARLGTDRVAAEPAAVRRLIELCAHLPLALAITAARAAVSTGKSLHALGGELAEARLDAFADHDPEADLRTVFSWSYTALSAPAARLFRLFGLLPLPDLSVAEAVALTGNGESETRDALAELAAAHLFTERAQGRFGAHDLLREYGSERAELECEEAERRAARERILGYLAHAAHDASSVLQAGRSECKSPPFVDGVRREPFLDKETAATWLFANADTVLALITMATKNGHDAFVWPMTEAIAWTLSREWRWGDMLASCRSTVEAADRLGSKPAAAYAHRMCGYALSYLAGPAEVDEHYRASADLYLEVGDPDGVGQLERQLGGAMLRWGRPRESLEHNRRALKMYRAAGNGSGVANTLNGIGWAHFTLGEYADALSACEEALAIQLEDDEYGAVATWDSLGQIHLKTGAHTRALECVKAAVALAGRVGGEVLLARTYEGLAEVHRTMGDPASARDAWNRALAIHREHKTGADRAIRRKLAEL